MRNVDYALTLLSQAGYAVTIQGEQLTVIDPVMEYREGHNYRMTGWRPVVLRGENIVADTHKFIEDRS